MKSSLIIALMVVLAIGLTTVECVVVDENHPVEDFVERSPQQFNRIIVNLDKRSVIEWSARPDDNGANGINSIGQQLFGATFDFPPNLRPKPDGASYRDPNWIPSPIYGNVIQVVPNSGK